MARAQTSDGPPGAFWPVMALGPQQRVAIRLIQGGILEYQTEDVGHRIFKVRACPPANPKAAARRVALMREA
eukprot:6300046-Pyramimonas_sp.AAC.1